MQTILVAFILTPTPISPQQNVIIICPSISLFNSASPEKDDYLIVSIDHVPCTNDPDSYL